jgi:threonine synthase
VKQALVDNELRQNRMITTANSINIARLIAQTFYYFYAYARLKERHIPLVFSVPCGNFGNLTAGILAKHMGLPVARFVAATNVNDSVPRYLKTGNFEPKPRIRTFSKAMDAGNPTNFVRMLDLFDQDRDLMKEEIFGASFNDDQTIAAVKDVFDSTNYILDPHGAVAYLGLQKFLSKNPGSWNGVFLETAHPSKFSEQIENIIQCPVPIPKFLQDMLKKEGHSVVMPPNYAAFREMLQS